jgi:hypothetical protein
LLLQRMQIHLGPPIRAAGRTIAKRTAGTRKCNRSIQGLTVSGKLKLATDLNPV